MRTLTTKATIYNARDMWKGVKINKGNYIVRTNNKTPPVLGVWNAREFPPLISGNSIGILSEEDCSPGQEYLLINYSEKGVMVSSSRKDLIYLRDEQKITLPENHLYSGKHLFKFEELELALEIETKNITLLDKLIRRNTTT